MKEIEGDDDLEDILKTEDVFTMLDSFLQRNRLRLLANRFCGQHCLGKLN